MIKERLRERSFELALKANAHVQYCHFQDHLQPRVAQHLSSAAAVGSPPRRVRARLDVIVGEGSRDLLPCTEVKDLRCKAIMSALVVKSDASDANEN